MRQRGVSLSGETGDSRLASGGPRRLRCLRLSGLSLSSLHHRGHVKVVRDDPPASPGGPPLVAVEARPIIAIAALEIADGPLRAGAEPLSPLEPGLGLVLGPNLGDF